MLGQNFLHGFAAEALAPLAALRLQLPHEARKDLQSLVAERRAVELREALDFVVGKVFVVDRNGHVDNLLRLYLRMELGEEKIDELLAIIAGGKRSGQHGPDVF